MARNEIVLAADPKGRFIEGIIDGTPVPGTCMQIKAGVEPVGGRLTYEVYNTSADGEQRAVFVLREDHLQGLTKTDAYVSGARGFLYAPAMGEELNMLVANISGTADAFAIGDLLMIDDGTGKLVATTGSPEMESFQVMETVAALSADTHIMCVYTGK